MAQPRQTLIVGGVDLSDITNKFGWHLSYEPRTGNNSGQSKGGGLIVDLYGYAMVLTFDLNALTDFQLKILLDACSARYVTATVYDPRLRQTRSTQFVPTLPDLSYAFSRSGTRFYLDGAKLTLTERRPYDYSA